MTRFLRDVLAFLSLLALLSCQAISPLDPASPSAAEDAAVPFHPVGALHEDEKTVQENLLTETDPLPALAAAPLPSDLDLSSNLPPVGDQGRQGSCVGWATAYAVKTSQEMRETGWSVATRDHQFSPSWLYNQINGGRDEGSRVSDALRTIVQKGADTLAAFPYDDANFTRRPDAASMSRASRYKASRWATLKPDVPTLKKQIAQGRALVITVDVYREFMAMSGTKPVYRSIASGKYYGGHALCAVGYSDELRAFKFINSWGTSWGDRGYGWVSYDFVRASSPVRFQAYVLYDRTNG